MNYLPAGSTPSKLLADATNPTTSAAGVFGGQVLALQLNVDFNAAGVIGSPAGAYGNLVLQNTGTSLDGKTVSQVLALAKTALGGGSLPTGLTYSTLNDAVDNLNESFDDCAANSWSLLHLKK